MDDAAIRKARAEYMREWRRKNPERTKAINQAYWAKKVKDMEVKCDESTIGRTRPERKNLPDNETALY